MNTLSPKVLPRRIAWLGPVGEGGGVPSLGTFLLNGVLKQGVQIDFYTAFEHEMPDRLREYPNLNIIAISAQWEWGRWYSKNAFSSFLSNSIARTRAYNKLSEILIKNHEKNPYDCVFQLSQTELFNLGKNLKKLPPIIVYPCVHAGGELRWHRSESQYALQVESPWMHYIIRSVLTYRTWVQKREVQKPSLIIGMSQRFNTLTAQDYGISPDRQAVLHNPIWPQIQEDIQAADQLAQKRDVIKLLFVARISVRKGVEYLIELSKRLDDLAGEIEIDVIGDRSQWSNYLPHLKDLNPRIAKYLGGMRQPQLKDAYDNADVLLLPSLYEPGGIVIGEALSHGVCIVVSDAIGSAEVVEGPSHREFPAGDMDRFEQEVRRVIVDLKTQRQALRSAAREQCQIHFDPDKIAGDLIQLLTQVPLNSSTSLSSAEKSLSYTR
jgi:glycosyltransferase involved in cell wall biosynthesis